MNVTRIRNTDTGWQADVEDIGWMPLPFTSQAPRQIVLRDLIAREVYHQRPSGKPCDCTECTYVFHNVRWGN